MANPLEMNLAPPPAPNPDAGNALQSGQGQPQQPQQAAPAPTHEQTVAALRHFDAIKEELTILLKNPALGKTSVKSQIIDGVSSLVSKRIISPAIAVMQLSKVPENPLEQRKLIQQQMEQTIQAERSILAHHAIGFAGGGPEPTPSADGHMDTMAALNAKYGGQH